MKISPEMIDAATIQLRGVFLQDDVPEEVRTTGGIFLDTLDAWAVKMREAEEAAKPNG